MFVEFLIAFLPVHVFFLCLIQVAILFGVRLVTEHAAVHAARAAAVVGGDDRKKYGNEVENQLIERGERRKAIRNAALITLTPLIVGGVIQTVDVFFPPEDQPDGEPQTGTIHLRAMNENTISKVRVRVEVEAICRIGFANRIACPDWTSFFSGNQQLNFWLPTKRVRAEAMFPYQGASYLYQ